MSTEKPESTQNYYDWLKKNGRLTPDGRIASLDKNRHEERSDMLSSRRSDEVREMLIESAKIKVMNGDDKAQVLSKIGHSHDMCAFILFQLLGMYKYSEEASKEERLGPNRANAALLLPGLGVAIQDVRDIVAGSKAAVIELWATE